MRSDPDQTAAQDPVDEGGTDATTGRNDTDDDVLESHDQVDAERDRSRRQLGATGLLAGAAGLVVIAWFLPLLSFTSGGEDPIQSRIGIWATTYTLTGFPITESTWSYGIPLTIAPLLALWTVVAVLLSRSRGRVGGWAGHQLLFGASAGVLAGTCGMMTSTFLSTVSSRMSVDAGYTLGAGLYLLAASTVLAGAAFVLCWLAGSRSAANGHSGLTRHPT